MEKPIGIIDSGVGGLSIAFVLFKDFPKESFIYLADSANCPYGQKTEDEIYELTRKMVDFLIEKEIKLLVVACNTITVTAISKLRRDYKNIPIVGIVPVLKTAAASSRSKKIGVFSTKITSESQYLRDLINRFAMDCTVVSAGSSDLVGFIENLDFESVDKVLEKELEEFKINQIDTLALGCSHFPLIKDRIQKVLPKVLILDSSGAVSRQVGRILKSNDLYSKFSKSKYNFYTTGDIEKLKFFAKKLTIKPIVERISLHV